MIAYVNSLIAVIIVCEAALRLSPDSVETRRALSVVCSLAVILTVAAPIRNAVPYITELGASLEKLVKPAEKNEEEDKMGEAAAVVLGYVEDIIGKDAAGASLTFVTDGERVTELQVFLPRGGRRSADRIKAALSSSLTVKVNVFAGEAAVERGENDETG